MPFSLAPVLDTGAEHTIFDGRLADALGWSESDVADRAEDFRLVHALSVAGQPLTGHLHRLRCPISLGRRFAELTIRVLLTAPNTLATPVLGRSGFFRQVDFSLVEAEQRSYLRFRDRSPLHEPW